MASVIGCSDLRGLDVATVCTSTALHRNQERKSDHERPFIRSETESLMAPKNNL